MFKEKGQKSLSLAIALLMIISIVPMNVFATTFDNQVVLGNGALGTSSGVEVKPEGND